MRMDERAGLPLHIAPEVRAALDARRPVVALESAVITHGLPRPLNRETARAVEAAVRAGGAVPATTALADGEAIVGADEALLSRLAADDAAVKASTRDIAPLLARSGLGGTTVAATVELAWRAGIGVMATGGIGGVHRGVETSLDVSADLEAIARHPVCVVCSGAKIILDLERTLEVLETLGVPVVGFGTRELPGFYVRTTGLALAHHVDDAAAAARVARAQLARGAGLVVTVPVPEADAVGRDEAEREVARAVAKAADEGVRGAALTPYLLGELRSLDEGRALRANVALLRNNAAVAAAVAAELVHLA